MDETFILKVYRGVPQKQYWEEFELPLKPMMNIITALMHIRKHPINRKGETVDPIAWEDGCLEEVCGSCSMLINQKPRQACSAIIKNLIEEKGSSIITLAPFTKFPLIRDLMVDRSSMFESLKKVHAWIETDGAYDRGPGPQTTPETNEIRYSLSTCMTCGCCVEGCPQVNDHSRFIGPAAISQARLFNSHPTGKKQKAKRLRALMTEGGVSDCGNAQNCAKVCPKNIPLTDSIAAISRDVTIQGFKDLFSFEDRS